MSDPQPAASDEMRAFDALPRPIRDQMNYGPYNMRPTDVRNALIGMGAGTVLRMVRGTYDVRLKFNAGDWQKAFAGDLPHVAAGATLMQTDPLP